MKRRLSWAILSLSLLFSISPVACYAAEIEENQTENSTQMYENAITTEETDNEVQIYDSNTTVNVDYMDGVNRKTGELIKKSESASVPIVINVPSEFDYNRVYVQCFNMQTYETFGYNLYDVNDFSTVMYCPVGQYLLDFCCVVGDNDGKYFIPSTVFDAYRDGTTPLFLDLQNRNEATIIMEGQTYTQQEFQNLIEEEESVTTEVFSEVMTEEANEVIQDNAKHLPQNYIVLMLLLASCSINLGLCIVLGCLAHKD